MSLLSKLFQKLKPSLTKSDGSPKTSGEIISELTGGTNLVDGKQTWEYAEDKKHDIEIMKRCCEAELETMEKAGIVPAPYYFERVAILSRKEKNYVQEIEYCELYINKVNEFYRVNNSEKMADVRKGRTYNAIVNRLPKAKQLMKKAK